MFLKSFNALLLTPIRAFRWRYLPLLMIYFAYGASSFSGIAESFFVKEHLHFSAEALMMLSVWLTLPWTIKMVFGQFVDSIPILGSNRVAYVFLAAGLMACGSLLLAGLAGHWFFVRSLAKPETIYFLASLFTVIGMVLQDVVADAMSVDVVPREGRTSQEIHQDLAMVQLLGRVSLGFAIFIVAGLGGWLAQILSYQTIFLISLIIPVISVSGCLIARIESSSRKPVNLKILLGGLFFAVFVITMGVCQIPYDQEIIFIVSMIVVIYFLMLVTTGSSKKVRYQIFCAAVVIFVFRATPSVGPGLQWWEIDVLGFNKAFFGTLGQIGAALSIIGMWVFSKYLTQKSIAWVFIVLTIVGTLLSLPVLGMYYGLHEWTMRMFGFGAHTIALVDTALASPFDQLSMIPMLTLIAINAPKGNAATWFALMASLMNLAVTASGILSKQLNQHFVVTREIKNAAGQIVVQANYSHLGVLLWISILVGLIAPIAAVLIFMPKDLR